jgi:hypothetical protein
MERASGAILYEPAAARGQAGPYNHIKGDLKMKGHGGGHSHDEELRAVTIELEADQIEALEELSAEYARELGADWDLGAVVRVAVGDCLTKLGKMT